MHSLRQAELKTDRALEHLNALKTELQIYYDSQPVVVSRRQEPELGRRILRFELKDPSDRTYLLAGDFVHNLRSSLDHVLYSLVIHATQAIQTDRGLQWPVVPKPESDRIKQLKHQIKDAPAGAIPIIKSFQPFTAGSGDEYKLHPIWQLHRLDIIDKHRRIAINRHEILTHFPVKPPDIQHLIKDDALEFSFPIDSPFVDMEYGPKPDVFFGDESEDLVVSVERLQEIYTFVTHDVLPRFAGFFA